MSDKPPPKIGMAPDDTDLIHKAQQGDMDAFEQLIFKYDKQVFSLAARYVTRADDAKDIYQEVFLRVHRGLKNFRHQSEFSTWLHRITTNVCLTYRAKEKRGLLVGLQRDNVAGQVDSHDPAYLRDPGDPPDHQAMNAEFAVFVQQALESLSPKQRLVFTLRHYQGYKLKEIATMMNCMEGTVKRYLFAATRRMREHLRDVR